ncbi:hypothetical protein GCM10010191_52540 [Actinomadura vinacea]|uniref:Uncharacterized protein n=1 Tax=Actinomadura vinacea TaxID=115336 RepID=A0ABP5WNY1_9ACTN
MNAAVPCPAEVSRVVTELRRRFPGARVWWGEATREWWAMLRDRSGRDLLVEADSPAELSHRVAAVLTVPRFARVHQPGAVSRPAPGVPAPRRPAMPTEPRASRGRHELPRRGLLRGWR